MHFKFQVLSNMCLVAAGLLQLPRFLGWGLLVSSELSLRGTVHPNGMVSTHLTNFTTILRMLVTEGPEHPVFRGWHCISERQVTNFEGAC